MMRLLPALLCILMSLPAFANNDKVEDRMMHMAEELRCLVCQNESVAASRADFAVDIRELIRERIRAGDSDAEILAFLVSRYGDFILYRPPLKATTLLLWFGPTLLMIFGLVALIVTLRRRRRNAMADTSLSEEEEEMAEALLGRKPRHGASS